MNFEEVIKKRRSVRRFKQEEVSDETIRKILELANLSPSAGNLQARSVVVVKDKEMKEKITKIAMGQNSIAQAPVLFVICAEPDQSAAKYGQRGTEFYSIQDATIFASYLQLVVVFMNLDSCWIGAFDESELKKALDLSENKKPIAIIPVGFADEIPYKTDRKNLDELIEKQI